MKLNRLTAVLLLLCMLCFSLAGCAKQDEYPKTIVDGDYRYEISLVEPIPADAMQLNYPCWAPASSTECESRASVIARGVVSNIREIEIEICGGSEKLDDSLPPNITYATLFDFQIEESYRWDKAAGAKDTAPEVITVYYPVASRDYPYDERWPDRFALEEGKSYYIFIENKQSLMEYYNGLKANGGTYARLTEGESAPYCSFLADYYVLNYYTLLIPEDCPEDFIEWALTETFDNEFRENDATRAFFDEGVFTISALEAFLRAYGQETERILQGANDATPVPEDMTPAPEDMTPVPEDITPAPDDASKRQDG